MIWSVEAADPRIQRYYLLWKSGRIGREGSLEAGESHWTRLRGKEWENIGPFQDGDKIYSIHGCTMDAIRLATEQIGDERVTFLDFVLAAPREDLLKLAGDWILVLERRGRKMEVSVRELVAMDSAPEGNP